LIRFWDTSALVKLYSPTEAGHREVLRRLHGPRAKAVRQTTSMIAAVELVSALARRTKNAALVDAATRQLETFSQVGFGARHRDLALRLARSGLARGADTAIAAQVLMVAEASVTPVEFLTADEPQARLLQREATARRLEVTVVELPV
jgi:predicted nucleic acid-binding protein